MQSFPQCNNEKDILETVQKIVQLRKEEDIPRDNNLTSIFVSGRTTKRIPSAANDVVTGINGDRIGDTTNDDTYIYILVNTSGGALWTRIALSVSW